jgi:hypothetical protein
LGLDADPSYDSANAMYYVSELFLSLKDLDRAQAWGERALEMRKRDSDKLDHESELLEEIRQVGRKNPKYRHCLSKWRICSNCNKVFDFCVSFL